MRKLERLPAPRWALAGFGRRTAAFTRLAFAVAACAFAPRIAVGKMVMGIARGNDFALVTNFCFTFAGGPSEDGKPPQGSIHSQTIVSSPDHKFVVVNRTELENGASCDSLVKQAKVLEPLTEASKEVIAYDLTLNVEQSMNRQHIAAIITRCGNPVSAEYMIEFTNAGGAFERQFSCSDQGIFAGYLWFSLAALVATPALWYMYSVLRRRQAHNDISALFMASASFCAARVWLFTLHLVVYSQNGMGLGMLLFVAQFLDFLSTTMMVIVLVALVHGVYVTRQEVPLHSEERALLLQVLGAFVVTYAVSMLACGFKVDDQLTPFGMHQGFWSWPYVLCRGFMGVFCVKSAVRVSNEGEGIHKRHLLLRFATLGLVWLWFTLAVMLFTGEDSWSNDVFLLEMANFGTLGVLLYHFWPTRFGSLFSCAKPTRNAHPYAEFGAGG